MGSPVRVVAQCSVEQAAPRTGPGLLLSASAIGMLGASQQKYSDQQCQYPGRVLPAGCNPSSSAEVQVRVALFRHQVRRDQTGGPVPVGQDQQAVPCQEAGPYPEHMVPAGQG